jgi:hypothetical protein
MPVDARLARRRVLDQDEDRVSPSVSYPHVHVLPLHAPRLARRAPRRARYRDQHTRGRAHCAADTDPRHAAGGDRRQRRRTQAATSSHPADQDPGAGAHRPRRRREGRACSCGVKRCERRGCQPSSASRRQSDPDQAVGRVVECRAARAVTGGRQLRSQCGRDRTAGPASPTAACSRCCASSRHPERSGGPEPDAKPCGWRSPMRTGSPSARLSHSASSAPDVTIAVSGEEGPGLREPGSLNSVVRLVHRADCSGADRSSVSADDRPSRAPSVQRERAGSRSVNRESVVCGPVAERASRRKRGSHSGGHNGRFA